MATFAAHGALGAGVIAAPLRLAGAPQWLVTLGSVYGFILGSAPDLWDYFGALFGLFPRWELYVIYHSHTLPHWGFTAPWYLIYQLPFFLHVWIDTFFHNPALPGWNWWPQMGWLEIIMWAVSALLIWVAYYKSAIITQRK